MHIIRVTSVLLGLWLCLQVNAQTRPTDQVIQEIDRREQNLRDQQTQRELEQRRQEELKEKPVLLTPPEVPTPPVADDALCFTVTDIQVQIPHEQTVLPLELEFVQEIIAPFKGQCLNMKAVTSIIVELLKHSAARGYTTTRFYLPEQDLSSGTLIIYCIPGRLANVIIEGQNSQRLNLTLFRFTEGQLLNIRHFEQGIEQIKNAHNLSSTISIKPADRLGYSDIIINIQEKKFWSTSISLDNAGTESTGDIMSRFNFGFGNVFGMADNTSLGLTSSTESDADIYQRSLLFNYRFPFKYFSSSYTYNSSEYSQYIGVGKAATSTGDSESHDLAFDISLARSQSQTINASISLNHLTGHSFINETEILVQRKKRSNLSAGLNVKRFFGANIVNVSYKAKQGVSWFGAQNDKDKEGEDAASDSTYEYLLHTLDISLIAPISFWKINANYYGVVRAQFTQDVLYGTETFSIGSRYSVRGFGDETFLSAEKGAYMRNELSFSTSLQWLAPYLGLDAGMVSGPSEAVELGSSLAGVFAGFKGGFKNMNYNVFTSKAINKPEELDINGSTVGATLSMVF